MAVRIKSKWHRSQRSRKNMEGSSRPKTIEDLASVIAFNIWKLANESFRNMRKEDFQFEHESEVTCMLTEVIAFLIQVADRTVFGKLEEDKRGPFINTLAKHLVANMAENKTELLGPADYVPELIDTLNRRFGDYSECTFVPEEGSGYAFRRTLGKYVAECMSGDNTRWVVEQVMDIEAPKMVQTVSRLCIDVLGLRGK